MQEMFDKDVAPFQQKYVHLVEDIHNVYGTAKEVSELTNALNHIVYNLALVSIQFHFWF